MLLFFCQTAQHNLRNKLHLRQYGDHLLSAGRCHLYSFASFINIIIKLNNKSFLNQSINNLNTRSFFHHLQINQLLLR